MRQKSMLLACALALGIGASFSSPALAAAAKDIYYIVTHVDLRKCISPVCGGWFVKRVNHAHTKCADGTWQPECHVFDLDVSAIGLSEEEEQMFEFAWGASHALVRGSLSKVENGNFDIDTLHATEAWTGVAESTAKGSFYGVTDSGIVCITFPCPSFTEAKLNTAKIANIHGVDLAASGATEDKVNAGYAELAATGVLLAGKHTTITGPAGHVARCERVLQPCASRIEVRSDAHLHAGPDVLRWPALSHGVRPGELRRAHRALLSLGYTLEAS